MQIRDAQYFASSLSDKLSETPEGFLICRDVKIARIGTQKYLGQELGTSEGWDKEYTIYRLEDDVFHADTLASFEGKPVTDDHPSQFVGPDNHSAYIKGHAQNVRRDGDYIVADLFITDAVLISKIKNKLKREVSCGYNCQWEHYRDGYRQTDIRGNHIAVVEKGRAGPKVRITDNLPKIGAKKIMNKKQALSKMFAAFAKDASPEEIEQVSAFVFDAQPEVKPEEKGKADEAGLFKKFFSFMVSDAEPEAEEKPKKAHDSKKTESKAVDKALDERLTRIEDAITKLLDAKGDGDDEDDDEKALDEAMEAEEKKHSAEDEDSEEEKKEEDEDEEGEEKPKKAEDSLKKQLIKDMAPFLNSLPKGQRQKAKDAFLKSLKKERGESSNAYAGIKKAVDSHAKGKAEKQAQDADPSSLGRQWAEKHNPHYKNRTA